MGSEDKLQTLGANLFKMVAQPKNPIDAVKVALVEGADPNHNNPVTALYIAVDNDNEEYCRLLLQHGVSIVQKNRKKDVDMLPVTKALSKSPSSKIYKLFVDHIAKLESTQRATDFAGNTDEEYATPIRGSQSEDSDEPPKKRRRTNSIK